MENRLAKQEPFSKGLFADLDGDTPAGEFRLSDFYKETPENGRVLFISTAGREFRSLIDACRLVTAIGWACIKQMPAWKQMLREDQLKIERKLKLKRLKNKRRRRASKARRKTRGK